MDPDRDNDYLNLTYLKNLIKEEKTRLEEDKLRLQRNIKSIKKPQSDGNQSQPLQNITSPKENNYTSLNNAVSELVKEKCLTKKTTITSMIKNSREEEKNKLIEKISKPKEQQFFTSNKEIHRSYVQTRGDSSHFLSPIINLREREKDQLSEKFASTESPLSKPSCRQISKNLCCSISFSDCKQNNLETAIDENLNRSHIKNDDKYVNGFEKHALEEQEDYLRAKYNHPRIVVSQSIESDQDEGTGDNKMVRIGEFSPLNPNLPGGATVLGLGDWDEKRQLLLQKYRQVSRSPSPSPCEDNHTHHQRSIATQTEPVDDWSPNISLERSPQHLSQTQEKSHHRYKFEELDKPCISPIPKCFENLTEKEIKEFIYRQELQKQIDEKNRFKEEMKRKELEEEAKIEAKIQRDQEKMRRQYEEERLQRLELAIRKREKEDALREKLAVEQQKAMQVSKTVKKRQVKDSALPNYVSEQHEKSTQSDFKKSTYIHSLKVPYSRSLPEQSTSSILSSVHKELRQPLLQPSNDLLSSKELEGLVSKDKSERSSRILNSKQPPVNVSISPPISVRRSKEVDILAQEAVFNTSLKPSPRANPTLSSSSNTARDKIKEVDDFLKQPLLPESRVLPPVSQPLLHATIPPLSASLQTPRISTEVLDDKWKVPYVERDTANTKHNAHILTQLGTFRRQLHEESLRMRQRVKGDSP